METGTARPVDGPVLIDDARLERIADLFIANKVYERFGVTFEEYLSLVASGMCHYYVFCKGAADL